MTTEIELLQARVAELERLARRVIAVAPYVRATVRTGNGFDVPGKPDWIACHRGRCSSSQRQLENLEREARATLGGEQ